jgi:hypothetical protein
MLELAVWPAAAREKPSRARRSQRLSRLSLALFADDDPCAQAILGLQIQRIGACLGFKCSSIRELKAAEFLLFIFFKRFESHLLHQSVS